MDLLKVSKELEKELMKYGPLFGEYQNVPWIISPMWFEITESQLEYLKRIGLALRKFLTACNNLYYEDAKVRNVLNLYKPEKVLHYQKQKTTDIPLLVRPDIVFTRNGLRIVETEVIVGGIGEVPTVKEAYSSVIPPLKPYSSSIVTSFIKSMEQIPSNGKINRTLLVTSFPTRFPELRIFSKLCKNQGYDAVPMRLDDIYGLDDNYAKLIWRLFDVDDIETFASIPNIPIKPPLKQFLEEKAWLGFLHNTTYDDYWESSLGQDFYFLRDATAKTWILSRGYMQSLDELEVLTKGKRQYVTKLSHSWGSKSFTYWPEKSTRQWRDFLLKTPESNSLYIMQEYQDSLRYSFPAYTNGEITYFEGLRAILTPYYFLVGENVELADIQVTLRKSRKVHGATDSIIIPVAIK